MSLDTIAEENVIDREERVAAEKATLQCIKQYEELILEHVRAFGYCGYSDLVKHHSGETPNLRNLEIILQRYPDTENRSYFLNSLNRLEVDILQLFLRYEKDVVPHLEAFRTRIQIVIHEQQNDVLEALLEVTGHHFEKGDFSYFVACALQVSNLASLDIVLRYIDTKKEFDVSCSIIFGFLIPLPVEFFDRLYLRGFDPFQRGYASITRGLKFFANHVINEGHHSLMIRLFEMNVIRPEDYREGKDARSSQRYHFRQLLLANETLGGNVFLQQYLAAQKHSLPMVRALAREAKFFNRAKRNSIHKSTVEYLDSLRPETNSDFPTKKRKILSSS